MSREDDINKLIFDSQRRLQKLKEQKALLGISVDPKILLDIEDTEAEVLGLKQELLNLAQIPLINPYRGLSAFREEDTEFFFGRQGFAELLVNEAKRKTLIALIGPSGSGKSSLIFAGLIPRLRRIRNIKWVIANLRPGDQPFSALSNALLPLLEPELSEVDRSVESQKLALALEKGHVQLYNIVVRLLQKQKASRLLLVVDQFEELYSLSDPSTEKLFQHTFLRAIKTSQAQTESPLTALLNLRADFLGVALAHHDFAEALQEAVMILGPMSRQELAQAIEKPAEKQGVSFESKLINRILDDVGDEAGNLPLLEFALAALWERQEKKQLTHTTYEEIGRVSGALTRYAEEVYRALEPPQQEAARHVLLQMVRSGEATGDTRRLTNRTELGNQNWSLVRQLADARLVVTDRRPDGSETAEVIHEALITNWGQLKTWLDSDRVFRVWQERLRSAIRQWETSHRDEGALLRGVPLGEAENWLVEREADISETGRNFIRASLALREKERLARERQRRRTIFGLSAGLGVALIGLCMMAGLAIFSILQWRKAETSFEMAVNAEATALALKADTEKSFQIVTEQKEIAFNRQLIAQSMVNANTQLDLALLLSLEASERSLTAPQPGSGNGNIQDIAAAQRNLLTGLAANPFLDTFLRGHVAYIKAVAFSPDGKILASAGGDDTIILWDVEGRNPIGLPLVGHEDTVLSLAFNPTDALILASGSADGTVRLWDLNEPETPRQIGQFEDYEGKVYSLAFSPDGKILASGGEDGNIRLWNVANQTLIRSLEGHESAVTALAFDMSDLLYDKRVILASGSRDTNILIWNIAEPAAKPRLFTGHEDTVTSLAFYPKNDSSNGRTFASGSLDETIIIWNEKAEEPILRHFNAHTNGVLSLTYSSDGGYLASSGPDKNILLWGHPLYNSIASFTGHTETINAIAFRPDQERLTLVSGDEGANLILWQVSGHRLSQILAKNKSAIFGVTVSAEGRTLASGGEDDSVIFWDAGSGRFLNKLNREHEGDVLSVAFSPVNLSNRQRLFASGGAKGSVVIRSITADCRCADVIGKFTYHTGQVLSLAFYAEPETDATFLASGDDQGSLLLWSIRDQTVITPSLLAGEGSSAVTALAFSSVQPVLASAKADGVIIIWDFTISPTSIITLTEHSQEVTDLSFSPDGQILASAGRDGQLILWDVEGGEAGGITVKQRGSSLIEHETDATSVAFSPDGQTLASGDASGLIILRDRNGQPQGDPLSEHKGEITGLVFVQREGEAKTILASSSRDGGIILWDVAKGQPYLDKPLTEHVAPVSSLAFSVDGQQLAAGTTEGIVVLWDIEGQEAHFLIGHENESQVSSVAFSPDGQSLASSSWDKSLILWDLNQDPPEIKWQGQHEREVMSVAFSPDGQTLASSSWDNKIILWEVETGEQLLDEPLDDHKDGVRKVLFSPDGRWLASASQDGTIILWDVQKNYQPHDQYVRHSEGVTSLSFSPDGKILASGSEDTKIILWDVETGEQIGKALTGHRAQIDNLTFSQNGEILVLASGSQDETMILWDVSDVFKRQPQPLGPALTRKGTIALALDPKTKKLATGDESGAIILWNLDFKFWQDQACYVARRNLTRAEWIQFFGIEVPYRETCPTIELSLDELVKQAETYALTGDKEAAKEILEAAVQRAAIIKAVDYNNHVCWFGSLSGFAQEVMAACEAALQLAPPNKVDFYKDSYGVALALTGQYEEAVENFEDFIEWSVAEGLPERYRIRREAWISALDDGRNPFDETMLELLRNE